LSIGNLSTSNDTVLLRDLLRKTEQENAELYVGNAGTVARFLCAFLVIQPGRWTIMGSERMNKRPVKQLIDALISLGAEIEYLGQEGYTPVRIQGREIKGGRVVFKDIESSQFITAMMLIAPFLENGLEIHVRGRVVSHSYISLTINILARLGVKVDILPEGYRIKNQDITKTSFSVERDWSSASYWYEALALARGGELFLPGLSKDSSQGDRVLADIYNQLGVQTDFHSEGVTIRKSGKVTSHFNWNFINHPDIVPSVAVTCCGLNVKSRLEGITHLMHKESDRLDSLLQELNRMGIKAEIVGEDLVIHNHEGIKFNGCFHTYDDHRMAMSLAPVALITSRVGIDDPEVVGKSYPGFLDHLKTIGCEIVAG
jgi:3-phosphoshikimate 1-carboxyvinyltransferase